MRIRRCSTSRPVHSVLAQFSQRYADPIDEWYNGLLFFPAGRLFPCRHLRDDL